jgi:hypothetical protein
LLPARSRIVNKIYGPFPENAGKRSTFNLYLSAAFFHRISCKKIRDKRTFIHHQPVILCCIRQQRTKKIRI